jgi:hypothetical protein
MQTLQRDRGMSSIQIGVMFFFLSANASTGKVAVWFPRGAGFRHDHLTDRFTAKVA